MVLPGCLLRHSSVVDELVVARVAVALVLSEKVPVPWVAVAVPVVHLARSTMGLLPILHLVEPVVGSVVLGRLPLVTVTALHVLAVHLRRVSAGVQ